MKTTEILKIIIRLYTLRRSFYPWTSFKFQSLVNLEPVIIFYPRLSYILLNLLAKIAV